MQQNQNEIDNIKYNFENLSLNYSLFEFQSRDKQNHKNYFFPIKRISSFNNTKAVYLSKNITRTISLKKFCNG